MAKLSKDNVARVEAMIHHNSDYDLDYDTINPEKVAFKFQELKSILEGEKNISTAEYRKQIEELVTAIDKENKTHLKTDGQGIKVISERIADIDNVSWCIF